VLQHNWLKVTVLILLPINAWLGVFYYLHWQRQKAFRESLKQAEIERGKVVLYLREKRGKVFREGQRMPYPFPFPTRIIGIQPPLGRGYPILFLNISWIASYEVWEPALKEALEIPNLWIVLLYRKPRFAGWEHIIKMLKQVHSHRVSVLIGGEEEMMKAFDSNPSRILLILCDGQGIIRFVEYYPDLRLSAHWEEEVTDWRPKLHQAVKKVLDKFFQEGR